MCVDAFRQVLEVLIPIVMSTVVDVNGEEERAGNVLKENLSHVRTVDF